MVCKISDDYQTRMEKYKDVYETIASMLIKATHDVASNEKRMLIDGLGKKGIQKALDLLEKEMQHERTI